MYYINDGVARLDRVFDQNKREGYLRLDLNENPGGLPAEFVNLVLKDVTPEFLAQYPETIGFTQTLARFLGTEMDRLCLVNGSAEGIRHIIEAYTAPMGKIVGVVPTYAMFDVFSSMYGRQFISVPYTQSLEMPIQNIIEQLSEDVQLLILLNPNNPMGNVYSEQEIAQIIEVAREKEITVLIDEAYHYFYPNSFIDYALTGEHVFITRTFSKLFSLAGCRLGYVVGWPKGIELIQKLCTPHNVNALGMKFAQAIIETDGLIDRLIFQWRDGKNYLTDALKANGYQFNGQEGNFIFIKPKSDAEILVQRMKREKKILLKMYSGIGPLGKCLRVTTGETHFMERFMDALLELDK